MFKKWIAVLVVLLAPWYLHAGEITGKIKSISVQGKVIKYLNPKTKDVTVLKFTDETELVEADSFKDLTVNTKFQATVNDDGVAVKIKRILVKLPPEQVISTDELEELIDSGDAYFLGDARPKGVYDVGHLPGAVATPATSLEKNLHWLPKDKATPLVFYCGGVTCPLSPKAMKIAMKNGYTNAKAYVEGYPAWKGDVYPTHVNADWLAKNLDIHHVILDVRENGMRSVKGAVRMPASELADMHDKWNAEKFPVKKRLVLGVRDKKAPVIIISDREDSDDAIEAYELLTFWKYANVNILKGGVADWQGPVGKPGTELTYVKKPVPGAVDGEEFAKAVKAGSAVIIDVRDDEELAQGYLESSVHIPLSALDSKLAMVPKDKKVILHCAAGARASLGYATLKKHGYKDVHFLNDDFLGVAKDTGLTLVK